MNELAKGYRRMNKLTAVEELERLEIKKPSSRFDV
jgi:hypothetical protein